MSKDRTTSQVASTLAKLERTEFQNAVTGLLSRSLRDFQQTPRGKDGGLDGLSGNQSIAYCCYGIEQSTILSSDSKALKKKVCEKFQQDLRRITELGQDPVTRKLVHRENAELKEIHTGERKIANIRLISNWFDHRGIIGTMQKALNRYLRVSNLTYINMDCTVICEGPSEFSARVICDDQFFLELESSRVIGVIDSNYELDELRSSPDDDTVADFDGKMAALSTAIPQRSQHVKQLADEFFSNWIDYIGIKERLDDDCPLVYERLLQVEREAIREAQLRSIAVEPTAASEVILGLSRSVQEQLEVDPPVRIPPGRIKRLSSCLIGFLIGVCHVEWRP